MTMNPDFGYGYADPDVCHFIIKDEKLSLTAGAKGTGFVDNVYTEVDHDFAAAGAPLEYLELPTHAISTGGYSTGGGDAWASMYPKITMIHEPAPYTFESFVKLDTYEAAQDAEHIDDILADILG